jgi:hypothetical protein
MSLDHDKVSRFFKQQALVMHHLLEDAEVYVNPISEQEFFREIETVLNEQINKAARNYNAFQPALARLDRVIEKKLAGMIPMSRERIANILTRYAVKLHKTLEQYGAYQVPLNESEFRERSRKSVEETANRIADSQDGFVVSLVVFPTDLLSELKDVIPCVLYWDYEFGYKSLLDEMKSMLIQAQTDFNWVYLPDNTSIKLSFGDATQILEDVPPGSEVDWGQYRQLMTWLTKGLTPYDLSLIEPATGDQTGTMVLVPKKATTTLKNFFVTEDNPRIWIVYPPMYHDLDHIFEVGFNS